MPSIALPTKAQTRFQPTVFDPWWEQKAKHAANTGLDRWSFLAGGGSPDEEMMTAAPGPVGAVGTVATRGIRQITDPDIMQAWLQGLPTGLRDRLREAVSKWSGGFQSRRPHLRTDLARAVHRPGAPEARTQYRTALDKLFGQTHPGGPVRVYRGSNERQVLTPRTHAAQDALEAIASRRVVPTFARAENLEDLSQGYRSFTLQPNTARREFTNVEYPRSGEHVLYGDVPYQAIVAPATAPVGTFQSEAEVIVDLMSPYLQGTQWQRAAPAAATQWAKKFYPPLKNPIQSALDVAAEIEAEDWAAKTIK